VYDAKQSVVKHRSELVIFYQQHENKQNKDEGSLYKVFSYYLNNQTCHCITMPMTVSSLTYINDESVFIYEVNNNNRYIYIYIIYIIVTCHP